MTCERFGTPADKQCGTRCDCILEPYPAGPVPPHWSPSCIGGDPNGPNKNACDMNNYQKDYFTGKTFSEVFDCSSRPNCPID